MVCVRVSVAGKGGANKPASAHMEHLLGSFLRATPSAAAAAAAAEHGSQLGFEYDWEADENERCLGNDDGAAKPRASGSSAKAGKAAGKKGRASAGTSLVAGRQRKITAGAVGLKKSGARKGVGKKKGGKRPKQAAARGKGGNSKAAGAGGAVSAAKLRKKANKKDP